MNSDAIKDFLFRHFEKFIFAGLMTLSLFLIYQGVQKPDIMKLHQPAKMESEANQVKSSIDDDHWATIAAPRVEAPDIIGRTKEAIKPVDPNEYSLSVPWEVHTSNLNVKRSDPKIPAPIDVQVQGVICSLATKTYSDYALKLLEPADPVEKMEKKVKKLSRKEEQMKKQMEMMMGSDGGGYGMEMEDPSMYGMDPSMGASMAVTPTRRIDAKYDQGFRPLSSGTSDVQPELAHFIVGVALMPQKQIFDAFEEALSRADGYNPQQRDLPYYLGYEMWRAEVTNKPVDQLTDADWTKRGYTRHFELLLLRAWSGMAKEVVAAKYRDPQLTSPIPPILLEHYTHLVTHPKIPIGDEPLVGAGTVLQPKQELPTGPILPDADGDDPFRAARRAGTGSMMMDPMMAGMMSGMNMGYGMMNMKVEQPEYKLIRFYDFRDFTGRDKNCPQPGRKYVYRVRIVVEDPNFPSNAMLQPKNSSLSAEVFKRVDALATQAAKTKVRKAELFSEFSAPSQPVSLPSPFDSYVGPVDPGATKVFALGQTPIEFQSKPKKAKAVVTMWNPTYGAAVPVFTDVMKGTMVAKKGTIDIPDPIALEVKKAPDMNVDTYNVVLDIYGGKPLGISVGENQTEPGLLLMFDPFGGLEVVDEIDTQKGYRLYSGADDRGETP